MWRISFMKSALLLKLWCHKHPYLQTSSSFSSVSIFLCVVCVQVNHMQYMEVGDDNLSFAIWTGSDPDAEIFTMTVSSAEKKKDWLLALQKLQESQISFAMGKRTRGF